MILEFALTEATTLFALLMTFLLLLFSLKLYFGFLSFNEWYTFVLYVLQRKDQY